MTITLSDYASAAVSALALAETAAPLDGLAAEAVRELRPAVAALEGANALYYADKRPELREASRITEALDARLRAALLVGRLTRDPRTEVIVELVAAINDAVRAARAQVRGDYATEGLCAAASQMSYTNALATAVAIIDTAPQATTHSNLSAA